MNKISGWDPKWTFAAQLKDDRRLEDAARGVAEAALGLAEAIQLAKYDLEHDRAGAIPPTPA